MKVLNLRCATGHGFEGWFASEDDFLSQHSRGLLTCPSCNNATVERLPSAPRLNLSGARAPAAAPKPAREVPQAATSPPAARPDPADLHALWLQAAQQLVNNTEDVGERFPEEARRIHYGEAPERGIRGQASAEQRAELADEGIEVHALPLPAALKGPLQ